MGYDYEETFEINGGKIKTIVTADDTEIKNHISSFLYPSTNNQIKVFGFDLECHLDYKKTPRLFADSKCATLQICDGQTCLIIQLNHLSSRGYRSCEYGSGFKSLFNFLRMPNVTFVGVGIKENLVKLEKEYGIVFRNAVEIGPLAASVLGRPQLSYLNVDELCYVVNGFNLGEHRIISMDFDWGCAPLNIELAKLATINVYSYCKIGTTLLKKIAERKNA